MENGSARSSRAIWPYHLTRHGRRTYAQRRHQVAAICHHARRGDGGGAGSHLHPRGMRDRISMPRRNVPACRPLDEERGPDPGCSIPRDHFSRGKDCGRWEFVEDSAIEVHRSGIIERRIGIDAANGDMHPRSVNPKTERALLTERDLSLSGWGYYLTRRTRRPGDTSIVHDHVTSRRDAGVSPGAVRHAICLRALTRITRSRDRRDERIESSVRTGRRHR